MARQSKVILAALGFTACAFAANALADGNPVGFYAGAGLGSATPENTFQDIYGRYAGSGHEFGWDAFAGIRPIPWLGAEVQYLDFGHAHFGNPEVYGGPGTPYGAAGHSQAAAAFAVGYLPLQWAYPWLDVYGKVGVAELWNSYHYTLSYVCTATGPCAPPEDASDSVTSSETDLAYGVGIQVRFGAFAMRAGYEALDSKFGNSPALFSIAAVWTP